MKGFNRLFRTAMILIPIGVVGNIVFSLATTDRSILAELPGRPRGYLYLALALAILPWFTNAWRLLIWTRFLGFRLGYVDAFRMTLGVDLGTAIGPIAVGGNFFKWGMLVQRGVSAGAAASIAAFPSIEDGIFFLLALPVAVILTSSWDLPVFGMIAEKFQHDAPVVLLWAAAIALLSWLAIRAVLSGGLGRGPRRRGVRLVARLRRRLREVWRDASEVFRLIAVRGKSRFALSLTLTGIQWIARYSVISALVAFLGFPVDPVLYWLLQWVVFTMMALIPTPGAAGAAEASFYLIYSALLPPQVIGLVTAAWRFLTFYLLLAIASLLFFLLNLKPRR